MPNNIINELEQQFYYTRRTYYPIRPKTSLTIGCILMLLGVLAHTFAITSISIPGLSLFALALVVTPYLMSGLTQKKKWIIAATIAMLLALPFFLHVPLIGFYTFNPITLLIFFGIMTLSDDLIFFPVLRGLTAMRNLQHDKKHTKAYITLIATALGLIIGGTIAYFILLHIPAVLAFASLITASMHCGITLSLLSCALTAFLFKFLHLPEYAGSWAGALLAPFLPAILPPGVDLVFGVALVGAFFCSFLCKQVMRGIYKWQYGHTNADGYEFRIECGKENIDQQVKARDQAIADAFNQCLIKRKDIENNKATVEQKDVTRLRTLLIEIIQRLKSNTSAIKDVAGLKDHNAFKDIIHVFFNIHKDEKNLKRFINLLLWLQCGDEFANIVTSYNPKALDQITYNREMRRFHRHLKIDDMDQGTYADAKARMLMTYNTKRLDPTQHRIQNLQSAKEYLIQADGYLGSFFHSASKYRYTIKGFVEEIVEGLTICDGDPLTWHKEKSKWNPEKRMSHQFNEAITPFLRCMR